MLLIRSTGASESAMFGNRFLTAEILDMRRYHRLLPVFVVMAPVRAPCSDRHHLCPSSGCRASLLLEAFELRAEWLALGEGVVAPELIVFEKPVNFDALAGQPHAILLIVKTYIPTLNVGTRGG
jgi:hypothetical protein